jgi:hypothetical protein
MLDLGTESLANCVHSIGLSKIASKKALSALYSKVLKGPKNKI